MALPQYNIEFYKGETFVLSITYKDGTGCALDLSSGYTAQVDGRLTASTGSTVWTVSTSDSSGTVIALSAGSPNIVITLTSAYTGTLTPGSGVWDLKLSNSGNSSAEYLLGGSYTINDPVTEAS